MCCDQRIWRSTEQQVCLNTSRDIVTERESFWQRRDPDELQHSWSWSPWGLPRSSVRLCYENWTLGQGVRAAIDDARRSGGRSWKGPGGIRRTKRLHFTRRAWMVLLFVLCFQLWQTLSVALEHLVDCGRCQELHQLGCAVPKRSGADGTDDPCDANIGSGTRQCGTRYTSGKDAASSSSAEMDQVGEGSDSIPELGEEYDMHGQQRWFRGWQGIDTSSGLDDESTKCSDVVIEKCACRRVWGRRTSFQREAGCRVDHTAVSEPIRSVMTVDIVHDAAHGSRCWTSLSGNHYGARVRHVLGASVRRHGSVALVSPRDVKCGRVCKIWRQEHHKQTRDSFALISVSFKIQR